MRLLVVLALAAAPLAVQAQDPGVPLDNGTILSEIFSNGEIGAFADAGGASFGNGFQFMSDPGLYESSFLAALSADQVSGEAYEWPDQEWTETSAATATTVAGYDVAVTSSFNDSSALSPDGPIGLEVVQTAYARTGDPFMFVDFEVTNTSGGNLTGVYLGVFADWDVGDFAQNLAGYNEDTQLLYVWDGSGTSTNYFGQALVSGGANGTAVSGRAYDALPGDGILWTGLTFPAPATTTPADRRTVLGAGPFDIDDGATRTITMIYVAGTDETDIIDNAQTAQSLITIAIEPGPDGTPGAYGMSNVVPNPFAGRATFNLEVAETQNVRVAVYDALGREVAVVLDGALVAGTEHTLALDASDLPNGVYLVRVQGEQFSTTRQVTLTR